MTFYIIASIIFFHYLHHNHYHSLIVFDHEVLEPAWFRPIVPRERYFQDIGALLVEEERRNEMFYKRKLHVLTIDSLSTIDRIP